jgi:two-component system sensor histidine kinase BaeS
VTAEPSPARGPGLATRLLAAQVLVVLAGALTAWFVAAAVGPPLFREHLERAGTAASSPETQHAEEAFRSANVISLSVALLAALVAAFGVSVYVTRRVGRSVGAVAEAAAGLAGGHYEARVPPPALGEEFDALARSFNQMAARLGSVEATRRRLLADLAHEMRTPVATLDGYLEGVEDGVTTLDGDTVAMLRTQTQRLVRLAEDVSAVSRAEEHQLALSIRPQSPVRLLEDAASTAGSGFADKGVELHVDVPPGLPTVDADADRVGQVLANLLGNALRHTPTGGSVTLAARAAQGGVELAVRDTGEGIPAQHLPHVFERFYRADSARDRARGGSGIGLAITKALVEAHGGHVAVSSEGPGTGSEFVVWLPVRG